MRTIFKLLWISIIAMITISSCQPDDDVTPISSTFAKGVFVVNQGPFQTGTGTITHKADNVIEPSQDVFAKANPGLVLGNIAQSMIKHGDRYYIAVNNANKIVVVDLDFKLIGTIDDVKLPRYFASNGSKLYLTIWGADFQSGEVLEINTTSLTIANSIKVGNAPEQMMIDGIELYVTISSPYGGDSKNVAIINTLTNTLTKTITVGDSPTAITKDKNGAIWVLCSGNYAFNPADNTAGALVKIGNPNVTFPLPNGASSLVTNVTKDELFFTVGNNVNKHNIASTTFINTTVYTGSSYAIAVNKDNVLHIANPGDFASNGTVETIDLSTAEKSTFKAGIIPGFLYFND